MDLAQKACGGECKFGRFEPVCDPPSASPSASPPGFVSDGFQAYIDFPKLQVDMSDIQWVVDPENWYVIARIDNQGLWRIVYGEDPAFSVEEVKQRLPERFRQTLPGHPDPDQYQVTNVTPYVCHQRCAEKMRVGRILLAGDAAHLNNPM
jgi:hypothetical protein